MKKLGLIFTGILMALFVMTSCHKDNFDSENLPSSFKVDIPDAISSSETQKSMAVDAVSGDSIYQHMRLFIAVGESSADIVQKIIQSIKQFNLDESKEFTYTSDADGRVKSVLVEENVEYDNTTWQYGLTMKDVESESDAYGGKGLQIFWNNNPIKGIAILYPYNINRSDSAEAFAKLMCRIDYSEAGEYGYEQSMIVSIKNLDVSNYEYALSALKMFVGRNGDVVNVYGNSAHPNAQFYNSDKGLDWAFVASGNQVSDLGVAEVGLPPYTLDENSRQVLLGTYAIHDVFTQWVSDWYLNEYGTEIDSLTLAAYLKNMEAPGFFNKDGFIAAGETPTSDYTPLVNNIQSLTPYNPKSIADLNISFK